MSPTTGNAFVDNGFRRSRSLLSQAFGLSPSFAFFDDGPSPNAFASPDDIVSGSSRSGSVVFGLNLILSEIRADQASWGSALAFIMGHEWAHIAQFSAVGPLPAPGAELHADHLGGWFVGLFNRNTGGAGINLYSVLRSAFSKGDYGFFSRDHHGTPQQRLSAAQSGYALGLQGAPFNMAFQNGMSFVRM